MSREKKEKTRVIQPHTVRRLLKYLMHYRWMFALALVLAVASNVFALVGPMLSGAAVDAIEPGKEKAWLLRVTVNCCRDLWRGAWLRRVVLGAPTLDVVPSQDETVEEREEKAELMRAVNRLPAPFRETILLHYYQGLGIAEIAQMLNLPEGTISSRLSRARKKLEVLLKEEATGE